MKYVHLAARTFAAHSLDTERARLIRMLVPVALPNVTTLDTVLGYLFIACHFNDTKLLERIVTATGAIALADEKPPSAQIGPDAAIPA